MPSQSTAMLMVTDGVEDGCGGCAPFSVPAHRMQRAASRPTLSDWLHTPSAGEPRRWGALNFTGLCMLS
jgi:hypothetical protein